MEGKCIVEAPWSAQVHKHSPISYMACISTIPLLSPAKSFSSLGLCNCHFPSIWLDPLITGPWASLFGVFHAFVLSFSRQTISSPHQAGMFNSSYVFTFKLSSETDSVSKHSILVTHLKMRSSSHLSLAQLQDLMVL